jgi:hypothetical protein
MLACMFREVHAQIGRGNQDFASHKLYAHLSLGMDIEIGWTIDGYRKAKSEGKRNKYLPDFAPDLYKDDSFGNFDPNRYFFSFAGLGAIYEFGKLLSARLEHVNSIPMACHFAADSSHGDSEFKFPLADLPFWTSHVGCYIQSYRLSLPLPENLLCREKEVV